MKYPISPNEFFLIGLVILSIIIQIILAIIVVKFFVEKHKKYLNSLSSIKINELKSDVGRLQRYSLIKNLNLMKKFVGWSILLIIIAIIGIATVIVIDSREYFTDYFEVQRKELNLRSEASVDSLQLIISKQMKTTDSLKIVNIGINQLNEMLQRNLTDMKKEIQLLNEQKIKQ